jgi:sulfite reductase subunit B
MVEVRIQSMDRTFYCPNLSRVVKIDRRPEDAVLELEMANGGNFQHLPGQFVQVSVFGYGEVPISVCSPPKDTDRFELCVRPAGNVSTAIAKLTVGDWVGVRGPYGRGFPLARMKQRDLIVVAGGIGLAPLRSLVYYVLHNREDFRRLVVIYGARSPSLILFKEEIKKWQSDGEMEFHITVDQPDENWRGRTGVVTEPLKEIDVEAKGTVAAVVGPPVMYRFVIKELLSKGVDEGNIYLSLERHFKCGIGKCGHCQLNDLYVCQDGPVFRYAKLLGHTEAVEVWAPEKDQD